MRLSRRTFVLLALAAGGSVLAGGRVSLPKPQKELITVELVLDLAKGVMRKNLLHIPESSTVFDATTWGGLYVVMEGEERTKRFLPVIEHIPNMYYRVNGKEILGSVGLDYLLKEGDVITWSTS
ncbi:MAG TPA: hypothetical protein VJC15_03535 [Candidatus Paceibacterota bacterium]